ncbi:class I SAM-dependent methyltransferase [Alteromonas flava]|uniref:class I SAM-dependent methyltransferase n=1 Tax=Alteromonas flava TaxID=2048003 RepID=UPI000C28A7DD|nr:class I SAM-dependent methyltransferase [Alteromonas flava]
MRKSGLILIAALLTPAVCADTPTLFDIVESRPLEVKARDTARNPVETLQFFKLEPGMTVAEALPGGGWYTQIIAPYVGEKGRVYGINYNDDMWARFGFFSAEAIAEQIALTAKFTGMVSAYPNAPFDVQAFTFATTPEALQGTADRVLFIRALHNLNRFEEEAGTLTEALGTAYDLLKEGGMVGVVQHRAPEENSDKWADGSAGYLKQSQLIASFEAAGFTFVQSSEINANPKDKPTESDMVWRLPPTYFGVQDDPNKKASVDAIGESDRMTLLFKK